MELDKQEWKAVKKVLAEWEEEGRISKEKGQELRKSIELKRTDNQQIAQYFFLVALSCILLAFGAIFIDDKVLERFKAYFALSNFVIAVLAAAVAVIWFWYVRKKRVNLSKTAYEIYLVVGALASLISLTYICKETGFGGKYSVFLFAVSVLMFTLSIVFKSRFLWIAGILGVMGFYGAVTSLYGTNDRFLGLNYPIRFTLFGMVMLAMAWLQKKNNVMPETERISFVMAMLVLFTGLWGVSIFGNYSDLSEWAKVRQSQVLVYGLVFGLAAGLSFYLGIKYRDDLARDMGIFFLLVNLYTRYFEFFWDNMNKGIFFTVLAASFYGVGRWLEKGRRKKVNRLTS
jgi:hypothetical protein